MSDPISFYSNVRKAGHPDNPSFVFPIDKPLVTDKRIKLNKRYKVTVEEA